MTKAVICVDEQAEAKIPIAANAEESKKSPIYDPHMPAKSIFPWGKDIKKIVITSVKEIKIIDPTIDIIAKYFPRTILLIDKDEVNNSSIVPFLFSSDIIPILIDGIRKQKI